MNMTHEEVTLHLSKWLEENTLLNVCFSVPDTRAQCCFGGHVTTLSDRIVFSHPNGNSEAYLTCSWKDVARIEYVELRESAERLSGIPGATDFMRERSNLILVLSGGAVVVVTDLSL